MDTSLPLDRKQMISWTNKLITTNMQSKPSSIYFPQQPFDSFLAAEGTTTGLAPLLPGCTEAFLYY